MSRRKLHSPPHHDERPRRPAFAPAPARASSPSATAAVPGGAHTAPLPSATNLTAPVCAEPCAAVVADASGDGVTTDADIAGMAGLLGVPHPGDEESGTTARSIGGRAGRAGAVWAGALGFGGTLEHVTRMVPELQNALGVTSRMIDVAEAKQLSPLIS